MSLEHEHPIEDLLHEVRSFSPSADFTANSNVDASIYDVAA